MTNCLHSFGPVAGHPGRNSWLSKLFSSWPGVRGREEGKESTISFEGSLTKRFRPYLLMFPLILKSATCW
jgi:hypothetical protein